MEIRVRRSFENHRMSSAPIYPLHGPLPFAPSVQPAYRPHGREKQGYGSRLGGRCEFAEQPILLIVQARRKVKRVEVVVRPPGAEFQRPEEWIDDRHTILVIQSAQERMGGGVICQDLTVAELADQKVASESAECAGCQRNSPRRKERSVGRDSLHEVSAGVELIHETAWLSYAHNVVGIRHEKVSIDVLNVEGIESRQRLWVDKFSGKHRTRHISEVRVEDVDVPCSVGCVEKIRSPTAAVRQPGVDRAGGSGNVYRGRTCTTVPAQQLPVQGIEEEQRRVAIRQIETSGSVGYLAGRAVWNADGRDRDNQRHDISRAIVEGRIARTLVRNPEW